MKKLSIVLILILAISMCSCNQESNKQNEQTQESVSETIVSASDDNTENAYNYDGVAKLHDSFQKCSSFLTTEMNFCKSMWEISNYSNDKGVHDSFVSYISKQNADKTISDSVSALEKAVSAELENCDPSLAPLLKAVSEKYSELADFLINPSGTYKEYVNSFDTCFDEYVFAFDEMTSYLYDVGYYTE